MNDFLEIGIIVAPHGVNGEVSLAPWCDDMSVFSSLGSLFDENMNEISIKGVKYKKNIVVLLLDCASSRSEAERLRGKILSVKREDLPPLDEDCYYIADVIGAEVFSSEGLLGTVESFIETGANIVYVVRTPENKEILIPDIPDVIEEADIQSKRLTVNLIEGLL